MKHLLFARRLLLPLAALFVALGFSSCKSVDYVESGGIGRPAKGKGLVVFYRPDKFWQSQVSYRIADGSGYGNAPKLCTLRNGTYFTYDADPGRHFFKASTEIMALRMVDVKAGHTYFVKGSVRPGVVIGRPWLDLVSNEEGRAEIAGLKRVQKHVEPPEF